MTYKQMKQRVFDILDKEEQNGILEKIVDIIIMSLIFFNVIAMIIEPSIQSPEWIKFFKIFEMVSIFIFTIEYILRLWVSDLYRPQMEAWKARFRYAFSGMAMIDLCTMSKMRLNPKFLTACLMRCGGRLRH